MNIIESKIYQARLGRNARKINSFISTVKDASNRGIIDVKAYISTEPIKPLDSPGDFDRDEIFLELSAIDAHGDNIYNKEPIKRLVEVYHRRSGTVYEAFVKEQAGFNSPDFLSEISGIGDAVRRDKRTSLLAERIEGLFGKDYPNVHITVANQDKDGKISPLIKWDSN